MIKGPVYNELTAGRSILPGAAKTTVFIKFNSDEMKEFIKKFAAKIKRVFSKLNETQKKYIPVAVNIVQALKTFIDGPIDDFLAEALKALIPGGVDDIIINESMKFIKKRLPQLLSGLLLIEAVNNESLTVNQKFLLIKEKLQQLGIDQRHIIWVGLSAKIAEILLDGKITLAEATNLTQSYYKSIN